MAAWFVPYPAHITTIDEENGQKAHRIEIGDFDNLHVTATTKEEAVHRASEVLLRTLAIAAQKGERVPSPGALPVNDPDYIMICPLNPGSTRCKHHSKHIQKGELQQLAKHIRSA